MDKKTRFHCKNTRTALLQKVGKIQETTTTTTHTQSAACENHIIRKNKGKKPRIRGENEKKKKRRCLVVGVGGSPKDPIRGQLL